MSALKVLFKNQKFVLVFMSYVSLLVLGLMDNIRGPFYPDVLNDLSLSSTRGSIFFAMASFAALGGNFLGSFLISRLKAHGLMNYSIFGLGFGFLLIGQSFNFYSMIFFCAIFGIHFGMLNVAQNVVVQRSAPLAFRRQIFNGLHGMYGLAALIAPLVANGFMKIPWSWPESFSAIGVFSLGIGLIFLITAWKWEDHGGAGARDINQEGFKPSRAFLLATSLGFYVVAELSLSTRIPLWVRTSFDFSAEDANNYMAIFCAGLFLSRMFFTFIHFKSLSNLRLLSLSAFLSAVSYSIGLLVHPIFAVLSGLFMGPFFPVVLDEMAERFGAHGSKVISWSITFGSVMIVFMHFTLGVLTDYFGIDHALWFGPITLSVSLLVLFLSSRRFSER